MQITTVKHPREKIKTSNAGFLWYCCLLIFAAFFLLTPSSPFAAQVDPKTLLDQAKSLTESDVPKALGLAKRAANLAQASGETEVERQARVFLVDVLRAVGGKDDVPLYREQLDRLESLIPQPEPNHTTSKVTLFLLRTELALFLNKPPEAISHARAALTASIHNDISYCRFI